MGKEKFKEPGEEPTVDINIGMSAIKPEGWDKTGKEAFFDTLYNPKTGEILTRTPLSWLKIICFYIVYYSFLAGFWIACLFIFFETLPAVKDGPRWKEYYSLIGKNPGLGSRPHQADHNIDSNMFVLKAGDTNMLPQELHGEGDLNADYATRLQEFLAIYDNTSAPMGDNSKGEDYKAFKIHEQLGECAEYPYGYVGETVAPCVILKLNKIWDWTPRPIICTEVNCPETMINHINSSLGLEAVGPRNVWVDCQGRNAADKEALAGDDGIKYFPENQNFPFDGYFPYQGATDGVYHSPLVAVKFHPNIIGQLIHIECRAYYRGVVHNTREKAGLTQFELLIQ